MADCFAMEMDDLHRRWLPPEILADIGIADAASPPAAIEGLALHLAGLIGGGKVAPGSTPPASPASYHHHHQLGVGVPVCGLEGQVLVAYGGAAVCPFSPYSPVQWQMTQVATGFMNGGGGELDPTRWLGAPPATKRGGGGGGTGVFLPRAAAYQPKKSPAARGWRSPKHLEQPRGGDEGPTVREEEEQQEQQQHHHDQSETASAETTVQQQVRRRLPNACPELALPQEWSY